MTDPVPKKVLTYRDWTRLLCDHFFGERHRGRPVTFFVDDELLGKLSGLPSAEAGLASFLDAVNPYIRPDSYGRPFHYVCQQQAAWKRQGAVGCPPSLPVLALLVLAASRMARGEAVTAANYWHRFGELTEISGTRWRDEIPPLWEDYTWWLNEKLEGSHGLSTVRKDERFTIIGYALSQALFRQSDRQKLTEFFRRIDLEPGEELSGEEMLHYFKAWAPDSALTPGAMKMALDKRFETRLMAILLDEASAWDGVIRDEAGRKVAAVLLTFNPVEVPHFGMAAQRPEGFPESATFTEANRTYAVELHAVSGAGYDPVWPLQPEWLGRGLTLRSGDYLLKFNAQDVVPLEMNPDVGCWTSAARVQPYQEYRILAKGGFDADVSSYLSRAAEAGWQKADASRYGLPGWVLFNRVHFDNAAPERRPSGGSIGPLIPSVRGRPALKGGLMLSSGALRLYFSGGEPDLWLGPLTDSEAKVVVDGAELKQSLSARVALSELGLRPGRHTVRVEGFSPLDFVTVDSLGRLVGRDCGSVAHVLECSGVEVKPRSAGACVNTSEEEADGLISIAGARVGSMSTGAPAPPSTVLLPLGAERYVLLGRRPGEILEPTCPKRPPWMKKIEGGGLFPHGFEIRPPFITVWAIISRRSGMSIKQGNPLPADDRAAEGATPHMIAAWCSVFLADEPEDPSLAELWGEYRSLAARWLENVR